MKKILLLVTFFALTISVIKAEDIKKNSTESSSITKLNAQPVDIRSRLQIEMKELEAKARETNPDAFNKSKTLGKVQAWNFQVGSQHTFWARDFRITDTGADGYFYQVPATCRAVSEYCYVFIENAVWDSSRANQNSADVISNAFSYSTPADPNKGIYHIDTEVFGFPYDVDNDPRIVILILDIQDGWNGTTKTSYTGGYNHVYNSFTVAEGAPFSNQMEMFYQDAHPADAITEEGLLNVCATVAHEFQHMIQNASHYLRNRQYQITFFDEGCSEVASVLCGYPGRGSSKYPGETNINLIEWRRDNPNIVLNDYERAFRFMLYMYEQFGSDFLTKFITAEKDNSPQTGYSAFDIAFPTLDNPTTRRRKDVIWDWHLASVVENTSVNSRWGFGNELISRVGGEEVRLRNRNVSVSIEPGGAVFLDIPSATGVTATFTLPNQFGPEYVKIYAVKSNGDNKDVIEVTPNVEVQFADYGTTYTELQFVITSASIIDPFDLTYNINGTVSSTEPVNQIPVEYSLQQNYPNPFNPTTNITYSIPERSNVSLTVYNVLRKEIVKLVDENMSGGTYNTTWDGKDSFGAIVPSGIYFYSIQTNNYTQTRKMILLK